MAPRTDTQFSGINTSRWDGRLRRVLGGEGNSSAAMSMLAFQATPLWAGVRQCLLVITHFTQGWGRVGWAGRRLHGWAWKGPEDKSKRAGALFLAGRLR